MELQKVKYISDTPDVELAATIKKFCDLVEMQPPSQAKEFINLLRLGLGRYPFEMLENAFTMWMLKRSEVRATKICNIKWISDLLNEYIENNRHILQRKPKVQHIAIEAVQEIAAEAQTPLQARAKLWLTSSALPAASFAMQMSAAASSAAQKMHSIATHATSWWQRRRRNHTENANRMTETAANVDGL